MRTDEHINQVVFDGALVKMGRWRLPVAHPRFHDSGPARGYLVVFPRTSTWIQHEGGRPFVADPSVATLYNAHQRYTRRPIAAVGDCCEFVVLAPEVLRPIVARLDPASADAPERLLKHTHAPISSTVYLRQRQVYRHVRTSPVPDALFVEETMVRAVSHVLGGAYRTAHQVSDGQRDLVEHVREVIARRFTTALTLSALSDAAGTSVFHLCRVFKAATGITLHQYVTQVRLRASLERLTDAQSDLSAIALDLGFSTHSHFTAAFRACYGMTPSSYRAGTRE